MAFIISDGTFRSSSTKFKGGNPRITSPKVSRDRPLSRRTVRGPIRDPSLPFTSGPPRPRPTPSVRPGLPPHGVYSHLFGRDPGDP